MKGKQDMSVKLKEIRVSDRSRAILGFCFGMCIMLVIVRVFTVNSYDFENMQRGVRLIYSGGNPWAADSRISDFYNPPFAVLFLWPMLFLTPKDLLVLGGSFLFAFSFYRKAWVALAWFATNTFLWLIAAGGIDMFVVGAGILLLSVGEDTSGKWHGNVWRVIGYGFLLVKPQGGAFLVLLYILLKRDWKGFLISVLLYGLLFVRYYPDWLHVILNNPPGAQTVAAHTLLGKFGAGISIVIAILVTFSRRWKYWQLGGALAGILMPYGMPGLPIFLTLTGVRKLAAIPIIVIFSGLLAVLTWVNPPAGADFYAFVNPLMAIYHMGMLGLALSLASISDEAEKRDTIFVGGWVKLCLTASLAKIQKKNSL